MAETAAQINTRLTEVRDAIHAVMTGAQSYSISGRTVTRANLNDLLTYERLLERKLANVSGSGRLVLSDLSSSGVEGLPS